MAFARCEKLSTIVLGNSIERIEQTAFAGCKSLIKVELPNSIRCYSLSLFQDCPNLTELTLPEEMEKRRKDILDYACGKRSTGGWY